MISRLEIRLKESLLDAEGANIKRKAKEYFGFGVEDIRVIRILTIDADLDKYQLEMIRTRIFTNPVTEESSFSPMAKLGDVHRVSLSWRFGRSTLEKYYQKGINEMRHGNYAEAILFFDKALLIDRTNRRVLEKAFEAANALRESLSVPGKEETPAKK